MNIEFVEDGPPRSTGNWDQQRRLETREFAAELIRNPGRWAKYPFPSTYVGARGIASRISRGVVAAFGEGFQAVSRGGVVYVKYERKD